MIIIIIIIIILIFQLACGIVVHKHCQGRVPVCEHPHEPGQLVKMATEKVVSTPDDLDDLSQFLVEKVHIVATC